MPVFCIISSIGIRSIIIYTLAWDVFLVIVVVDLTASLSRACSFLTCCIVFMEPYMYKIVLVLLHLCMPTLIASVLVHAFLLSCCLALPLVFLHAVVFASMWGFHVNLLSRVTPKYFTESENGICIPSIFTSFFPSYFFLVILDLVNNDTTVLLAIKVSPHSFPYKERFLHTLLCLCAIYSMSFPPIIQFPSSVNSSPVTPFEFSI